MRTFRNVLVLVLALVACVSASGRPYYLSRPMVSDPGSPALTVYFGERELIWMNAAMRGARVDMQEAGACLHIAASQGDTVFYVDSVEPAVRPEGAAGPTWMHIQFLCPPETAPLHWHVFMAEMLPVLQALAKDSGVPDSIPKLMLRDRCQFSPAGPEGGDLASYWARYPFVAMQCGFGPDSVHVQRVRKR